MAGPGLAVSMMLNFMGFPIGSAIGCIAPLFLEFVFIVAAALGALAAIFTMAVVPER